MDIDEPRTWIGRSETRTDTATPAPLSGMAATLDSETLAFEEGDAVPPLWHWTYFLPTPRQSRLGADGHPLKGGFLPPIPLPRRMWAGSQIEFRQPLRVGDKLTRTSTIADVSLKQGRTGPLVFVKVHHEVSNLQGIVVVEHQDIVYRNPPTPADRPKPMTAPATSNWSRSIRPSTPLLFRYSALTFNSHRIHYDRPYAQSEEGYSGLVVHGPLIATLLLDLVRREMPESRVCEFSFRAVRPLIDSAEFSVCGDLRQDGSLRLWAQAAEGWLATTATARIA